MNKYFFIGIWGLILFEILRVYFIMPFPGSQEINSLSFAYFLHNNQWVIRVIFAILTIFGAENIFKTKKWIPILNILFAVGVIYILNYRITADVIFHKPEHLVFKSATENKVNANSLVIGVSYNGLAKAYPIQFLKYHHQVQDSIGGKKILVTYCDVCRSGIVFDPHVDGRLESFQLVGMDHYNALFEDFATKSWWRQSTGECVAGPLKGTSLYDFPSQQMTISKWVELHPNTLIMQADVSYKQKYDTTLNYDYGKSQGSLTGSDSSSWKNKSWIVGVEIGGEAIAYDWNELKKKRIINDDIGKRHIVIALATDQQSFCAFLRPDSVNFTISHDTLFLNERSFDFSGTDLTNKEKQLNPIPAKQEFWHSWQTFHPNSIKK